MTREAELAAALGRLTSRLAAAAEAAGRAVEDIALLPITKFHPASDVEILAALGCRAFGESRDQEATRKIGEIVADLDWHMVGQIQSKKARHIGTWAHTVHSVSTTKVVTGLGRGAEESLADGRRQKPVQVYVQLSLDGDESRGGVDITSPDRIDELLAVVNATPALHFAGFMAVPPLGADPEVAFARLEAERARVQNLYQHRLGLSAGMSGDLEAAVKHGSTCVRVGTALLGPRPLTSP